MITANLATIEGRPLKQVIDSIYEQVDNINIYLNGYTGVPAFLIDKKIHVFRDITHIGDIGDAGKFFKIQHGYNLTIDDDLEYPPDYVERMIYAVEFWNRQAVVSIHGRVLLQNPISSYYRNTQSKFRCLDTVYADAWVQIIGTGTMCFHTDTIWPHIEDFKNGYMADIWFSKLAQEKQVPLVVMKHEKGWIKSIYNDKDELWYKYQNNDSVQTEVINSVDWKIFTLE